MKCRVETCNNKAVWITQTDYPLIKSTFGYCDKHFNTLKEPLGTKAAVLNASTQTSLTDAMNTFKRVK